MSQLLLGRAPVSPDDVFVTASTSEAYSYLFGTLCDPGDAILVPTPSYPLFAQLAQLASLRVLTYRHDYDGSWHLAPDSLPSRDTIERERVRVVVAVNPNNPTGHFLSEAELARLMGLGLPVLCDEVFRSYPLKEGAPRGVDPLGMPHPPVPLLVLDGLSKRLAAPGLKLGWIVARGPGAADILERLEWYGDTFLSVGGAIQDALPRLLDESSRVLSTVQERLASSLNTIQRSCKGSPLTVLSPEGGWSAIVRLPHVCSEIDAWSELARRGVSVQPGHLYDLPFESSVVLSLLTPADDLEAGLERLHGVFAGA